MGNFIVTRDYLEKKQGDLRAEIRAMEERLEEKRKYEHGDYYRSLTSIWKNESCDFKGAAAEWKNYRQKDKEAIRYYTDPKARGDNQVRYYKDLFVTDTLFPVGNQSMAHLIPNDPSCSLAWLRALSIITGTDIVTPDGTTSPLFDEKLRTFVEGKAPEGGNNADVLVPLKTWNWNFFQLPEKHYKHFDRLARGSEEQLILSPIWDPSVEWKPCTGYKIMVAASPKTYQWLLGREMLTREESEQYKWLAEASPDEPLKGTDFLKLTVRALADLLVQHGKVDLESVKNKIENELELAKGEGGEVDTPLEDVFKAIEGAIPKDLLSQRSFDDNSSAGTSSKKTNPAYKKKAIEFEKKIEAVINVRNRNLERNGRRQVQVPILNERSKKPVLVIDLGVYFEGKEHLIPDPFLVVLKAAVSWSAFCNQKLLPACGNHSDRHQDVPNEELIPAEIWAVAREDAAQGDDDSVFSLSENLTGPPGDRNSEALSTVSPSGKTAVMVVTP